MSRHVVMEEERAVATALCWRCNQLHNTLASHYDRFVFACGIPMWALRPKRNVPLILFPWPGPNLTRRELAEKESFEDGTPYIGAQNYD